MTLPLRRSLRRHLLRRHHDVCVLGTLPHHPRPAGVRVRRQALEVGRVGDENLMCGGEMTQSLSAVGLVAYGSVLLVGQRRGSDLGSDLGQTQAGLTAPALR